MLLPFSACVTNFSPEESYFWRCRRSLTSLFGSYSSTSLPSNYFSPYVTLNIFLLNVTLILNSYCIASPCFNFFFHCTSLTILFFYTSLQYYTLYHVTLFEKCFTARHRNIAYYFSSTSLPSNYFSPYVTLNIYYYCTSH